MFSWIVRFIERHPSLHRMSLVVWRLFPPRVAGFLKGILARNWLVGAIAVIVDGDTSPAKILLVEHSYRPRGAWGLPGGTLESIDGDPTRPGSTASPDNVIEDALRRELREELGMEIDVIRLLRVDAVPYVVEEPGPYRLDFYYLCKPATGFEALRTGLRSGSIRSPSPEIVQIRLVSLAELDQYDLFSADIRFLHDDLPRFEPTFFAGADNHSGPDQGSRD